MVKKIVDGKYDDVVIGFHDIATRKGSSNYGISQSAIQNWYALNKTNAITLVFGSPLAAASFVRLNRWRFATKMILFFRMLRLTGCVVILWQRVRCL
ncbi:hypothetical protein KRR40_16895 [Niabella defluvii]|nr:hypothetical protein KRR40_16895 [Niabella sp. I65]